MKYIRDILDKLFIENKYSKLQQDYRLFIITGKLFRGIRKYFASEEDDIIIDKINLYLNFNIKQHYIYIAV